MSKLTITWGGILDVTTCQKCKDLIKSKAAWIFETGKDPFPSVLSHPVYGVVWDCDADESRAHGQSRHRCRCRPTWIMDDVDLKEAIRKVKLRIEGLRNELQAVAK